VVEEGRLEVIEKLEGQPATGNGTGEDASFACDMDLATSLDDDSNIITVTVKTSSDFHAFVDKFQLDEVCSTAYLHLLCYSIDLLFASTNRSIVAWIQLCLVEKDIFTINSRNRSTRYSSRCKHYSFC
jgi:hypothetical protein